MSKGCGRQEMDNCRVVVVACVWVCILSVFFRTQEMHWQLNHSHTQEQLIWMHLIRLQQTVANHKLSDCGGHSRLSTVQLMKGQTKGSDEKGSTVSGQSLTAPRLIIKTLRTSEGKREWNRQTRAGALEQQQHEENNRSFLGNHWN